MSMQEQFKEAIEKELVAILKRNDEMELAIAMNKQSVMTIADLLTRMTEQANVPEGYERNIISLKIEDAANPEQVIEEHLQDVAGDSEAVENATGVAKLIQARNNDQPVVVYRKVIVNESSQGSGHWNQLSSPNGLLEFTIAQLLANHLSSAISVASLIDSYSMQRHGFINIRPDLDIVYEELKDLNKPMDRVMDLHLTVMEWHDGVPFIDVLQKRPSGFYCFSDQSDHTGKPVTLSVKSLNAMVLLTYNPSYNVVPTLAIYADITQDKINAEFINDMFIGLELTLSTMAHYALESPESRKARLQTYHACALS